MAICSPALTEFGAHVLEGLSPAEGKHLSPRFFYDDLGSALFEAITLLPEYGLTRADERLLERHGGDIAHLTGPLAAVLELGSGNGKKSLHVLRPQVAQQPDVVYRPIDVSSAALLHCQQAVGELCRVLPVCNDWMAGLTELAQSRAGNLPVLLLFVGSSVGNLERRDLPEFLSAIRSRLRAGDCFLLGADLVKNVDQMIAAYDDATGVTAAFNLNVLNRINRELDADIDLRGFAHEARWNAEERRIEMHLLACRDQVVNASGVGATFHFRTGETIWTESSHKFELAELARLAETSGFQTRAVWVDKEWPLAEVLWQAC